MSETDGTAKRRELREVDTSAQEWGSDLIADMLKAYGFEYASYNPGASFRGIEESLVNYNDNVPQTIQVSNEGLSVAVAHGYAKATGEPGLCILHNGVGTLNGSMGIFNAYADRVPIVILGGNGPVRKSERRPWIDWVHSHIDQGSLVDGFIKWYDQPAHSDGVPESIARGVRIADSGRKGPVYLTIDRDVQENRLEEPIELPDIPKLAPPSPMAPDPDSIEAAADRLLHADKPVILVDQVGDSREAVDALETLAETLGAPVIASTVRYNFPNTHPLYFESVEPFADTDLLLALDVRSVDYFIKHVETSTHEKTPILEGDPDLIEIGIQDVGASSNVADYYDLHETDVSILSDTELAIPALVEAVEDRLDENQAARQQAEDRAAELADRHADRRERWQRQADDAWDETPISVPRLAGELWEAVQDEEWVIVAGTLRGWPHRLWDIDEYDQYIGGSSGGAGVGYQIGAAIGGALAYEDSGRIPINLQADGDLMQFLSGLWTVAHYDIPLLTVVHNNRTLYNSTNHRMELAEYRGRDDSFERALIGTGYYDPAPDFAAHAEAFEISGYGPIEDPAELGPALAAAWEDVREGKPALVDVIAQPR